MMATLLKPWFDAARPHEDIREGRLDESVFAADLMAVVRGTAPEVYRDAVEFFRKTYMTAGLGTILKRVAGALEGTESAGDRVISLQTAFGGGKTHTLLALYHMAQSGKHITSIDPHGGLAKALASSTPDHPYAVAVFTNTTCDPVQGRITEDDITIHTLWGELAYQLGGKALYDLVRPNDETRVCPQGIFTKVLAAAAPCLILLDELADYCVAADGVAVNNTTLADQTVSFITQLVEAVGQVPRCTAVATLPASATEVAGSEGGQLAFATLEKRFGRIGADVRPVADDEISAVVRTRLFEQVDPEEAQKVADAYLEMYKNHVDDIPEGFARPEYRDRIVQSYPFHPALLDDFYQRWGSHADFQRTRGVLRLMATVVGALWKNRGKTTVTQPLIQPCDISWLLDATEAQLTRLWGIGLQSVVAADISGPTANAVRFDMERDAEYQREHLAEGVASAILLGSFGKKGDQSGYTQKELHLVCSRPGINWSLIDSALIELDNSSFYLHSAPAGNLGKRYWYGTKPTLNKLVAQYKQQTSNVNYDDVLLEELRSCASDSHTPQWNVLVAPGKDLSEQRKLTLCILEPSLTWSEDSRSRTAVANHVMAVSLHCGAKDRRFRNTLLFLAPTQRGLVALRGRLHERAALEGVREDYSDQLDAEQGTDLSNRIAAARADIQKALGPAYSTVLRVDGTEVASYVISQQSSTFANHLTSVWKALVEEERVLPLLGPTLLRESGIGDGTISLRSAVETFLQFTDKPMVTGQDAVVKGIARACKDGTLGIGVGTSAQELTRTYCKEEPPDLTGLDGVWVIPPFKKEVPPVPTVNEPGHTEGGTSGGTTIGTQGLPSGTDTIQKGTKRFHSVAVHGSIALENWRDATRPFVGAKDAMGQDLVSGIELDITVRFLHDGVGENDQAVAAMDETARQLKLRIDKKE
jgi:hypothetical protein